ncbi:olfactory receptor 14I1-like [Aegotheles albertisi]
MFNSSSITQFLLLAFADRRELQLLHFWLFLGICLAALLANGLIITTIACDHHLHTPMYFFLLNLSLLDLASISTTVPKAMANSLWDTRAISYQGCAAQLFFFVFFILAEFYLLTLMSYDRYVAICKPLQYRTLLGSRACVHMAAAAWGSGFLTALLHTANTFSLPLCQGNALDQFFCEIPQILKLSCSHFYLRELGLLVVSACVVSVCFVFIVVSYVQIFRVVLRIPSEQGRHKAFSTCLPHLAVVSLFVTTAIFANLKPSSISSPTLDLMISFLYSVVPPVLNPLIYSMRNKELKAALWKQLDYVLLQTNKGGRNGNRRAPRGSVGSGISGVAPAWFRHRETATASPPPAQRVPERRETPRSARDPLQRLHGLERRRSGQQGRKEDKIPVVTQFENSVIAAGPSWAGPSWAETGPVSEVVPGEVPGVVSGAVPGEALRAVRGEVPKVVLAGAAPGAALPPPPMSAIAFSPPPPPPTLPRMAFQPSPALEAASAVTSSGATPATAVTFPVLPPRRGLPWLEPALLPGAGPDLPQVRSLRSPWRFQVMEREGFSSEKSELNAKDSVGKE